MNKRQLFNLNNAISANSFRNFISNDPILDYLDKFGEKNGLIRDISKYSDHQKKRRNDFKSYVFDEIKKKFNYIDVNSKYNYTCKSSIDYTKTLMKNEMPIIIQGDIYCSIMEIYGRPAILVRSDILSLMFENCNEIKCINPTNRKYKYNYYAVDIKYGELKMGSTKVLDNKKTKSNLFVYQKILDNLFYEDSLKESKLTNFSSDFIQPYAFIIGSSYKDKMQKSFLNNAGIVNLNDEKLFNIMSDAMSWIYNLNDYGHTWNVNSSEIQYLYPNMKNNIDYNWKTAKKSIAKLRNEPTQYLDITFALRNKIYDSKKSVIEYIQSNNISIFLNNMIKVNMIDPIICNFENYKLSDDKLNFFVDFEYINSFEFKKDFTIPNTTHLYLIGIIYKDKDNDNDEWTYKKFMPNKIDFPIELNQPNNQFDEINCINEWISFMDSFNTPYRVIHWSHAEKTTINILNEQYNTNITTAIDWVDLQDIFKNKLNFICYGMKSYSLKDVAKSMYKLNYIKTCWDNDIQNGLDANMILIENFMDDNFILENIQNMDLIIKYNEIDCRVMQELSKFIWNITK